MSRQVTLAVITNRFHKIIAPAMGWDATSPIWERVADRSKPSVKGVYPDRNRATVGRVFIQKAPVGGRYRIVQITSESGGEKNLSDTLTRDELYAWMDGVLFCADEFRQKNIFLNADAARAAGR